MSDGGEVPPGIDTSQATSARMYDYWLGGHHNFAADRIAAIRLAEASPGLPLIARANRAFLGRVVRFLVAGAGIRQFLDLGTGLPTTGNVHQVAQEIDPAARVVYVDNDPMVLAHARALKTGEGTAVIHADLRDADTVLGHPETRRLLDFGQPIAVLFVSVLHFVAGDDARRAVASYLSVVAPGSYLALSHGCSDPAPDRAAEGAALLSSTASPVTPRPRAQILGFFAGLEMVDPGLVPVQQWRPDGGDADDPGKVWLVGGLGRCPATHAQAPLPPVAAQVTGLWTGPVPAQRGSGGQAEPPASVAHGTQPPAGIDASVPTAARMYDYWLGGHHNFAPDRIAAQKISARSPEAPQAARENRAFLQRAVRFLAAEAGIRQFLDLGTGLPTTGNVHQVAQAITPDARVVYVDNDPMVLAHAKALKTGEHAVVLHADLRDAGAILEHPGTRRLIDFSQPLAILFVAVLHFVPDPDAHEAVARFTSLAPPGSYLVLSHLTEEEVAPDAVATGSAVYARTPSPVTARPRTRILEFFAGLEVLEPGLVPVAQWRPSGPSSAVAGRGLLGAVGRKPR